MSPRARKITFVANTRYGYDVYWTEKGAWGYSIHYMPAGLTGVYKDQFTTATDALHAAVIQCWELEKQYERAIR